MQWEEAWTKIRRAKKEKATKDPRRKRNENQHSHHQTLMMTSRNAFLSRVTRIATMTLSVHFESKCSPRHFSSWCKLCCRLSFSLFLLFRLFVYSVFKFNFFVQHRSLCFVSCKYFATSLEKVLWTQLGILCSQQIPTVLTVVYNIQNYWVFGLYFSSGILK
jgi:hypothetical protein